jgi:RNA polymerase sigma-70 factor (ECF subfamily)
MAAQDAAGMVEQHWDAVFRLLFRLTHNAHDTEDLTQETFLRAMERSESFQPGTDRRAWLRRIATNLFLDQCRRRKVAKAEALADDPVDRSRLVEGSLQNQELGAVLEQAIAGLPETARMVFVLRVQEEVSFQEIARLIGATEETARWHMMKARRLLMERLEGKV